MFWSQSFYKMFTTKIQSQINLFLCITDNLHRLRPNNRIRSTVIK